MRPATGLFIAGVFLLPAAAWAQDPTPAPPADIPPPPPPDSDPLVVTLMPYGWLAGVSGPAEVSPSLPRPEVDSDSSSIFDNLNFFGFAAGEISKGRFGGMVDIAYVDFTFDKDLDIRDSGPVLLSGQLDLTGAITTVEGFYRFKPADDVDLDLLAGVRVFWLDLGLEVEGPLGGTLFEGEAEDTWADVVIGGRMRWTPGRWTFSAQADIGGGDDTSDWGAVLLADYQLTEHFGIVGGYRWQQFEYGKGNRDVDLTLDGPIIGATFTF
jgi:hypothetical protein